MVKENEVTTQTVTPNDLGWTDYVLSLLSDEEKINGNPTTDGLRRVFEIALNCVITHQDTKIVQSPSPDNGNRATAVHYLTYVLKGPDPDTLHLNRSVSGAADVFWGNCDKVFNKHPVAVAETRAEGRALRRGLKLRKVVAAEELAKDIEVSDEKINPTQINFFDMFGKRLDINIVKFLEKLAIPCSNVYNISYDDAVKAVSTLSEYQQSNNIPQDVIGYDPSWK
jgi:hypothetical protein